MRVYMKYVISKKGIDLTCAWKRKIENYKYKNSNNMIEMLV